MGFSVEGRLLRACWCFTGDCGWDVWEDKNLNLEGKFTIYAGNAGCRGGERLGDWVFYQAMGLKPNHNFVQLHFPLQRLLFICSLTYV